MALKFILASGGDNYNISDIVQKVTWEGRKNSPARSLQLQLLDDPDLGEGSRAPVDVYEGCHILFLEDGKELFRGIIMKQARSQDRKLTITAYDNAIYLSNNKDSFKYKNKNLAEIFVDVCTRFGITRGEIASASYKIPRLIETNCTIYDLLCQALSKTYKATGDRYYIMSKGGMLHLLLRRENITKWVLETGAVGYEYGNLTQYSYEKSIEETRTRLKLINDKGKAMAVWADRELETKIGQMQDVQTTEDKKKKAKEAAATMLRELKKPHESLSVTALGLSDVYTGIAVYISIPEINIGRTFYVDSDSHTWDGDYHSMKLKLNFAGDLESISEEGEIESTKSEEKSTTKEVRQEIKDAASGLKAKKAAEKKVIQIGRKAERAANAAERAAKNASRAKSELKTGKYAQIAVSQAAKAQNYYEQSKAALVEVKALVNVAQSDTTRKCDFAVQQAESSARRAAGAAETAKAYL